MSQKSKRAQVPIASRSSSLIVADPVFGRIVRGATPCGKSNLAAKRMKKFLDAYPYPDRPDTRADWLFQFAAKLTQPYFEQHFEQLFEQLQQAVEQKDFARFSGYYGTHFSSDHGQRYFELMKAYPGQFTEFSQVHHAVASGLPVDDAFRVGSANFDATRMVYGNAFEAFASNVVVLALLNNLIAGRASASVFQARWKANPTSTRRRS